MYKLLVPISEYCVTSWDAAVKGVSSSVNSSVYCHHIYHHHLHYQQQQQQ